MIDQQKQQANLPPALSFVAADFFKPVPAALMEGSGLDAAIFKFILHDWDDKVGYVACVYLCGHSGWGELVWGPETMV